MLRNGISRRLVAAALSGALVLGAPGGAAYQAAAQTLGRVGLPEAGVRPVGAPVAGPSSLGLAPLGGPSLGATLPSGLSASVSAPGAPVAFTAAPGLSAAAAPAASLPASALVPAPAPARAPAPALAGAAASVGVSASARSAQTDETPDEAAGRAAAVGPVTRAADALAAAADGARLFDGSTARASAAAPAPVAASAPRVRRAGLLARTLSAATLALGLLAAPVMRAGAQVAPAVPQVVAPAPTAANPPALAPPAAPAEVPLPRPLVATVAADRSDATVGERIHLTVTLRNPTDKTITVAGLRSGLQDALPEDLELQGKGAEAPLILAPGETKTVVYEAIPFASGDIALKDVVAQVSVAETAVYPDGIEIVLPESKVTVKSVLTPDWKEKGLRDIVDVQRAQSPQWIWVAGGALAFLLLIGLERALAARRWYPKLDARRLSLVASTEAELAGLDAGAASLEASEFHARVQEAVTRFMVDFAGLPHRERSARVLERDLRASKAFRSEHVAVASAIAARAETQRFSGADEGLEARRRDLARLRALVETVAAKSKAPAPKDAVGLNALGAAAGLQFGSPWALLLFVPFGVYIWKAWRSRGAGARFAVSSAAQASSHRSLRERLAGLPHAVRAAAVALLILALARPMIGVQRLETYTPSTDTMIVEDRSGSMDEKMGAGTKLQAAADAIRAYVDEQRKGTQNRVGMETFDDTPYVDVRLTTDYDALISHLKEIKVGGSTAIGEAILTAVGHFAEVNIMDLDDGKDPRVAEMKKILRDRGLAAALEYAKPSPDLMDKVLHPERAKVIVLFTDGESNTGIDPLDAAKIAASLGVKVYTVGVGDEFDTKTLTAVAQLTKAQFYKAGDAERMRDVLLEISRLEKSPSKVISTVSVKDYQALLALLAFMLLGAEAALGNTRLRTLQAMILAVGLQGVPLVQTVSPDRFFTAQTTVRAPAADAGRLSKVPEEMAEGNRDYAQGRYDEAVKKYAEALAAHPDLPELYFNMGDAYLRLGDAARAEQAYRKYIELTPDPVQQSKALFNLGDAALKAQDGEKAVEFFKEALRRDPQNQDAKWNLESLKKQQKEQQNNQQQKKGKKGQKGQKGEKGDQKGDQKGGQPGQPGDQKGDPSDPSKDPKGDKQKGADQLTQKLGEQQSNQDEAARKSITRKGTGTWGALALPLAGFAGQGIAFSNPWALAAVAVVVPLAALFAWWGLRSRLRAARALSPGTAPKTTGAWWGLRRYVQKSALSLAALLLAGLAATDPRGGAVDERVNFGGKDLVVAVDGSNSFVYAEDGRLAQAKKELDVFIERLRGTDRVGLVVFAGGARTASPISIDYSNFEFKLDRLEREARGLKEGSDLGASVKFAVESFDLAKKIGDRERILIVISDGEAFDSEIDAAIKAAQEHNVTVYAIGMGSPEGVKMKVPTVDGKGTEYIIDSKTGQPAVSHLEEGKLRRLAEATGGAYFRADKSASIDKVMELVASREKGRHSDTIKSPQPVGTYFLWPALALLLLDLLLPGRSLLRRDVPAPAAGKKKRGGSAGLMGVGAALVPLAAWPQILPFALLAVGVSALLAVDVWTHGALQRSAREAWQRRTGFVARGVRSDLEALFDPREADAPRLSAFLARWQSAKDAARPALIAEAAADDALWREKLVAAYLSGADALTHEAVLSALRRQTRDRLEPLGPVVARVAARRGLLGWLEHADAQERLAALEELAAERAPAAPLPPAPAPVRLSWRSRAARAAVVALFALSALAGGLAVDGTVRFSAQQSAAEQAAFAIFYGEDMYVFGDRYVDERIPQIVLPALRDWHRSVKDAGPEFERAMQVLRESPDPKADNLLVVAFRRAGLLPLDETAQTTLLKAMIERDSDALWASMDRAIAQSGDDARQAALLGRLVTLGVEVGDERAFTNLFRVLKTPNDEVRRLAFETLYGAMASSDKPFFERLSAINARFAADPGVQIWTGVFALRRVSSPGAGALDGAKTRAFLDQLLANASAIDAGRPAPFAAALAQAQKSGQEPQPPASVLVLELGMMEKFAEQAQGGDASAAVPAPLAEAVRYSINSSVTALIKAAEAAYPGLHAKLLADGVVLPDSPAAVSSGYEGEYGIYYGRGGSHYSSAPTPNYRERYKLAHLRALQKDLAEAAAAFHDDDPAKSAAAAEIADRAASGLETALAGGARVGMHEGGSVPEIVAEELEPLLRDEARVFKNDEFLGFLRERGFAPAIGGATNQSALSYPETLDAAQLTALRAALAQLASDGRFPLVAGARDLSWPEKLQLAKVLDGVDAALRAHYPAAAPAGPAPSADAFAVPGQDGLALARFSTLAAAREKDPAALLALEKALLAHLSGPRGATASADDLKQVFPQLIRALDAAGRSGAAWADLKAAVDAGRLPAAAVEALRPQAFESLKSLAEGFEKAFPDQTPAARLVEGDLRFTESDWRAVFKLRHYDALLKAAHDAAAVAAKTPAGETAEQKAFIARLDKDLPAMKTFAVKLGVDRGDAPGEFEIVSLNKDLAMAYQKLPGSEFWDAMVAKGLAVKRSGYDREQAWFSSYTPAQARQIRDYMQSVLDSGKWTGSSTRDLTPEEKKVFADGVRHADALLAAQAKAPATPLHGLAPLGLLLGASTLGPWAVAALLAAAATWLIWKYALRPAAVLPPSDEERAARAEGRRARIDFAARRMATSVVGGAFRSRFIGAGGSEFAEARPYAGEDYREIDWKTTAKKGETYAKKFELDRDMPLILLVDISRSGRFGTRGFDKSAVIADVASALALAASRSNVRVGAVLFSDRVEAVIPVRGGARHASALVDALLSAEAKGAGTDLVPALDAARSLSKSRAMVAVVSDFLAPDFKEPLAALSARHDLRAIRVFDPAETRPLPDVGLLPLVDAESGAARTLDTGSKKVRSDAAAAIARRENKISDDLAAARARPLLLSTEGDALETLAANFDPQRRHAAP